MSAFSPLSWRIPPSRWLRYASLLWLSMVVSPGATIIVSSTFDFDTEGWTVGAPSPLKPTQESDGGPGGGGDGYLLTQSLGTQGPGGRLAVFNEDPLWQGDFIGRGVTEIQADLRNFGVSTLSIRVAVESQLPNQPPHRAVTQSAHLLAAFGGWESASFSLRPEDLVPMAGSQSPDLTLGEVTQIRFLHNPSPDFRASVLGTALGLDNIEAIPEPGVSSLILIGWICLLSRRRLDP